ncbi:MAG: hypothetical protein J0L84_04185, partial [Verrucomicrobia bacterium]|nr:hypothetical protein [Verrucomicrobiota bacterium]
RALGVEALEFVAAAAPGSPRCRVHAPGRAADGREMVFKGGQNGRDRFLLDLAGGDEVRTTGSSRWTIDPGRVPAASSPGSRPSDPGPA